MSGESETVSASYSCWSPPLLIRRGGGGGSLLSDSVLLYSILLISLSGAFFSKPDQRRGYLQARELPQICHSA